LSWESYLGLLHWKSVLIDHWDEENFMLGLSEVIGRVMFRSLSLQLVRSFS